MPNVRRRRLVAAAALAAALSGACGRSEPAPAAAAGVVPVASLPRIDGAAILDTTTRLALDKFQGRAPGTVGEDITVGYLETRFKDLGLQPGNPDGTFIQKVPLVGITGSPPTGT